MPKNEKHILVDDCNFVTVAVFKSGNVRSLYLFTLSILSNKNYIKRKRDRESAVAKKSK